jgi:tRNA threonylcarbamoyladenosine biosynthesis protein TsaE
MLAAALKIDLPNTRATEALGAALARALPGAAIGAVVYLRGELGSGKTTCARSLLHALGVTSTVRSPTYTLVDTYSVGDLTCVHVDLYRLQTLNEVDELGLRDLIGPGYLMLIEWPEKGAGAVPAADLTVNLSYSAEARVVNVSAGTTAAAGWVSKLASDSSLEPYVSNLT